MKPKIVVFHNYGQGWVDSSGIPFARYCNSENILRLLESPFNVFFRISDATMSWEIRKGAHSVRLITCLP